MSNGREELVTQKKTEHLFLLCVEVCGRIILAETLVVAKIATTNLHSKITESILKLQKEDGTWEKTFMNIARFTRQRHSFYVW